MAQGISTSPTATFDEAVGAETARAGRLLGRVVRPCKMITPILEEIAAEHAGKLPVAKLNVDDNPDLAMRYDVMSIPTLHRLQGRRGRQARSSAPRARAQLLEELASSCGLSARPSGPLAAAAGPSM